MRISINQSPLMLWLSENVPKLVSYPMFEAPVVGKNSMRVLSTAHKFRVSSHHMTCQCFYSKLLQLPWNNFFVNVCKHLLYLIYRYILRCNSNSSEFFSSTQQDHVPPKQLFSTIFQLFISNSCYTICTGRTHRWYALECGCSGFPHGNKCKLPGY